MTTPIASLAQPVRLAVVGKYFGQLNLALAVMSLVPLSASVLFTEYRYTGAYAVVCMICAMISVALKGLPPVTALRANEALVIIAAIFVTSSLVMTLPLLRDLPPVAAWFETVSAVTTTGLSTQITSQTLPRSVLFGRAWLQWTGGLGMVVLSQLLLIGPGAVAKRLAQLENHVDDVIGGTHAIARQMLVIYAFLTLTAVIIIWLAGANGFDAVVHALTAVSTGGFSTYDDSLAGLHNGYVSYAVIFFSLCGAVPLLIYHQGFRHGPLTVWRNAQVRYLLLASTLVALFVSYNMMHALHLPWREALDRGVLLAVSAQSTAGFANFEIAQLDGASKLLLILAMAGGGSLGSTAGGMKIFRILILLRLLQIAIQRTATPAHAVIEPKLGRESLTPDDIERAIMVLAFFVVVIIGSWLSFVVAGYDAMDALFEVVSATGTVGLSTGISAQCNDVLKLVLCFDMLAGRVEIIALVILLYPRTWLKLQPS